METAGLLERIEQCDTAQIHPRARESFKDFCALAERLEESLRRSDVHFGPEYVEEFARRLQSGMQIIFIGEDPLKNTDFHSFPDDVVYRMSNTFRSTADLLRQAGDRWAPRSVAIGLVIADFQNHAGAVLRQAFVQ